MTHSSSGQRGAWSPVLCPLFLSARTVSLFLHFVIVILTPTCSHLSFMLLLHDDRMLWIWNYQFNKAVGILLILSQINIPLEPNFVCLLPVWLSKQMNLLDEMPIVISLDINMSKKKKIQVMSNIAKRFTSSSDVIEIYQTSARFSLLT